MEHDLLFKELLSSFFFEFLDLFFPALARDLDRGFGCIPITQELISDAALGEHREVDLLVRVKLRGKETDFLVHIENQATAQRDFPERMFRYFAHLTLRHTLPVYPIVVFSYDAPRRAESSRYEVTFLDCPVLRFDYRVVQLNRLSWRDFLKRDNPAATALMAKMKIARADRPKAKAELLRILVNQQLDPAKTRIIWVFVERYLQLTATETRVYDRKTARFTLQERDKTMELRTSWEVEAMHQEGEQIIMRQLRKRFGILMEDTAARIAGLTSEQLNELAEALLDFTSLADLEQWLTQHS